MWPIQTTNDFMWQLLKKNTLINFRRLNLPPQTVLFCQCTTLNIPSLKYSLFTSLVVYSRVGHASINISLKILTRTVSYTLIPMLFLRVVKVFHPHALLLYCKFFQQLTFFIAGKDVTR